VSVVPSNDLTDPDVGVRDVEGSFPGAAGIENVVFLRLIEVLDLAKPKSRSQFAEGLFAGWTWQALLFFGVLSRPFSFQMDGDVREV
jgi:hypothetical protein